MSHFLMYCLTSAVFLANIHILRLGVGSFPILNNQHVGVSGTLVVGCGNYELVSLQDWPIINT